MHPAYDVAQELQAMLVPACVRIEIAGSIRRQKPEPKDVELVCFPIVARFELKDMFNQVYEVREANRLTDRLNDLYASGVLTLDPVNKKDGQRYKRLLHIKSGVRCDLFIVTDPRKWGIIYTIRTGHSDFSKDLVSRARDRGEFVQHGLLHQHAPPLNELDEVQECPEGEQCPLIHPTPEETDFFAALDLPWVKPEERTNLKDVLARINLR